VALRGSGKGSGLPHTLQGVTPEWNKKCGWIEKKTLEQTTNEVGRWELWRDYSWIRSSLCRRRDKKGRQFFSRKNRGDTVSCRPGRHQPWWHHCGQWSSPEPKSLRYSSTTDNITEKHTAAVVSARKVWANQASLSCTLKVSEWVVSQRHIST